MKILDIIPHSQRGHLFVLEQARIEKKDEVVVYKQTKNGLNLVYNIPFINTNMLFLGKGCSITTDALLFLSQQGVLIGITGGNGLPLYNETYNVSFITPSNEYRPVKYNQLLAQIFFNEEKRLLLAKSFFYKRIENMRKYYFLFFDEGIINIPPSNLNIFINEIEEKYKEKIDKVKKNNEILLLEATYVKEIYKFFANNYDIKFSRTKKYDKNIIDNSSVNNNLTQLNYICYGIGNIILYTLGLSHSFPMFHGKTRRGGLTFDIADLIKDSFSVPFSFYGYNNNIKDTKLKNIMIKYIYKYDVLKNTIKFIINNLTDITAEDGGNNDTSEF